MAIMRAIKTAGCTHLAIAFATYTIAADAAPSEQLREIETAYAKFGSGDYREAARLSDKAVISSPRSAMAHTVLSLSYDGLGNNQKAKAAALKAIELDPNFELAYRALARVYLHTGANTKCIEAAQKSRALSPSSDACMLTALALMKMGRMKDAIAQARLGVKTEDSAATRWQLVNVIVDAGTTRDAVAETLAAYQKYHGIEELVVLRVIDAACREALRRSATTESTTQVKKLEANLPRSPGMSRLFREYYTRRNDLANAKKHADIVVALDSKNADSYRARAIINAKLHHHRDAIADLNTLLEMNPGDRNALHDRAAQYSEIGETENAIKSARQVVKEEPHSVEDWILLANSLYLAGRKDESLETITAAISANRGNAECFYARARLQKRLGNLEQAMRDLHKTIASGLRTNEIYFARAEIAQELRMYDSALEDFSHVESTLQNRRLHPKELETLGAVREGKAKCYMADGNFENAVKELTAAIEINPADTNFLLRAKAYNKLGKTKLAEQDNLTAKTFKKKQLKQDQKR